jgi:NAD(P)-dependent dehydrogenase (short-subunit alcohol dehydrogenase family)
VAMMRTWAVECEKIGVTVNALVPIALTRMVATIPGLGDLVAAVEAGEPRSPRSRPSARPTSPSDWSTARSRSSDAWT